VLEEIEAQLGEGNVELHHNYWEQVIGVEYVSGPVESG